MTQRDEIALKDSRIAELERIQASLTEALRNSLMRSCHNYSGAAFDRFVSSLISHARVKEKAEA